MRFIHPGGNLFVRNDLLIFDDGDCCYQYNCDLGLLKITRDRYLECKFGANYWKLQKKLPHELHLYNFARNCNGIVILSCFQESIMRIFNDTYDLLWEDTKQDLVIDTIYGIEIEKDCFWVAYPAAQIVTKYSLNSIQKLQELTVMDGLSYPEYLSISEGNLYICNMGLNELLVLNANNNISIANRFEEPIWEYARTAKNEYVKLESGIYVKSVIVP